MNSLADINWATWSAQQHATLMFVVRDGQILLIHKKRGLGAGKVNGPGGRLDPGETPLECAIRETEEELCTTPIASCQLGVLRFQFVDGLSIHGYVFRASTCTHDPQETDEAVPLWTPANEIPFDRMWQDDRYWLPHLLAGIPFEGNFIFDGDRMLDHEIIVGDAISVPLLDPTRPVPATSNSTT